MVTRLVIVAGLSVAAGAAATCWFTHRAATSHIVIDSAGALESDASSFIPAASS